MEAAADTSEMQPLTFMKGAARARSVGSRGHPGGLADSRTVTGMGIVPERIAWTCRSDAQRIDWLKRVPGIVTEAARRWSLELGPPLDPGGYCSVVLPARLSDGSSAVLKICLPHYEGEHEADGLRLWDGDGTVRLLDADADLGALLLERCEPGTALADAVDEPAQDEVVAGLLHRLWRSPPEGHPFRTLEALVAAWWGPSLARLADRFTDRIDQSLIRTAARLFDELPGSADRKVLLLTDLHAGNVLAAQREPWLAIDPKPFVGDPAYDATQHLFNCLDRVTAAPTETIRRFAGLLDVDAERVHAWLLARSVAEALEAWDEDSDQAAAELAACAAALTGAPPKGPMSSALATPQRADLDVPLVRRLVAVQFPAWAHLPIAPVEPGGWDNRTFRLGGDMSVRLPSAEPYAAQVHKEQRWLPRLAPHLPLPVPVPLAMGEPGDGFPWHWAVYRWLDGGPATTARIDDMCELATTLARFLTALQEIDPSGGPEPGPHNFFRGASPAVYDRETREAISALQGRIDTDAPTAVWEAALAAPWRGDPVWFHGDVAASNLLVRDGRLGAVIDFGCAGVGDPACDLTIAWTLFAGRSREAFRGSMAVDDGAWARARGWALWKALITFADRLGPGEADSREARRTIREVLSDGER